MNMALTRDLTQTVRARALRDREFQRELLKEGLKCLLSGDFATARIVWREYLNATTAASRQPFSPR